MSQITNTIAEPWRWIADIDRDTATGHSNCTGALVSPYHVLTAAHCVHSGGGGTGNFFDESDYTIIIGRDGDEFPYGTAKVTNIRALNGWINKDDANYDMALLTLDRRVGDYTGYFKMAALSDTTLENSKLNLAGYPSEGSEYNGDDLIHSYGPVDYVTDTRIYYKPSEGLEGTGGHSGAPVWRYKDGERQLVGVHRGSGKTHDNATRLTQARLNTWNSFIAADSSPANKPALMDYDEWFDRTTSTASSTSVTQGNAFSVSARVFNGGTARGNNVKVSFYASDNDTISKSDYLIGTTYVNVSQYKYVTAKWSGNLPSNIPAGSYYIGWEIDPDNTIKEFSDGSNDGVFKSRVQVKAKNTNPAKTILTSPGGTISDITPTFRWNTAANASWYYVYIQNVDTSAVTTQWVEGKNFYTPSNALAEGDYRFWVQTWGNGKSGPWSEGKDFTIQLAKPAATTLVGPGATISDTTPTFRWNAAANASWYYVYIQNRESGAVTAQWVKGTTSYTPGNALAEGNYRFWVRTWGNGEYGNWSNSMDFSIYIAKPSATTLISPTSTTTDSTPTFQWTAAGNASWYYVYIYNRDTAKVHTQWVQSTSYSSSLILARGNYTFWVQTWGNGKYGDWSLGLNFRII